jgi:mannose-6-phosphate isomerase-like protein (cupin superfamily)
VRYENKIVKKPWGYEYLAYENEHVALWFLKIKKGQQTSMHCHPSKTTGLMLLSGEVEVSFLSNNFNLKQKHKIMIRKGLFHSTKSKSSTDSIVFEIETPVDKHDLVRFQDIYGRQGQPYEDESFEIPKKSECVWIKDPKNGESKKYFIENNEISVTSVQNLNYFKNIEKDINVMFLKGGILTDYDTNVAGPGDIVSGKVLQKLTTIFTKLCQDTIVLTVGKYE